MNFMKTNELTTKKVFAIFGSMIVTTVLLFASGFVLFFDFSGKEAVSAQTSSDGSQFVELKAKNGFSPKLSTIAANKPATLKVNTEGTFDCSSTISIPSLGINQSLPSTGSTSFNIPALTAGTELDGTCSMGMYSFSIKAV